VEKHILRWTYWLSMACLSQCLWKAFKCNWVRRTLAGILWNGKVHLVRRISAVGLAHARRVHRHIERVLTASSNWGSCTRSSVLYRAPCCVTPVLGFNALSCCEIVW
jgi:hypothetical protein